MIPAWAILQGSVFIRDEWFASAAGQYHLSDLLPHWPWYWWVIGWLGILLAVFMEGSYRVSKKVKDELDELKTPKIRIEHNAQDIWPIPMPPGTNVEVTRTRCTVRLVNESAITLHGVELYRDEFRVLVPFPEVYTVILEGGCYPRDISGLTELPAGIADEIVEKTTARTDKRFEVHVYSRRPGSRTLKGKEFLISVHVEGDLTVPSQMKTYRFGDRAGKLFFEEYRPETMGFPL